MKPTSTTTGARADEHRPRQPARPDPADPAARRVGIVPFLLLAALSLLLAAPGGAEASPERPPEPRAFGPGPAAGASAGPGPGEAACTYNFEVGLRVRHQLAALQDSAAMGATSPLEDVRVRVSARVRAPGAWWKPWETVRTDEDGETGIIMLDRSCRPKREYRIRVMFRSDELEVRQGSAGTPGTRKVRWYTIARGDLPTSSETIDLDAEFAPGGDRALGDREPRHHAEIWALYRKTIDHMEETYGSRFAFENKVKVKYPHTPVFPNRRTSYANPTTKVVYLVRNDSVDAGENVGTMLHELMHIWAYQHSRGEGVLSSYFLTHGFETHGVVQNDAVAFHEAFAEYAEQVLQGEMLSRGNFPREPRTHPWLRSYDGATTAERVLRADQGWRHLFALMAEGDVWEYDFKAEQNRAPRSISLGSFGDRCGVERLPFEELLRMFERGPTSHGTLDGRDLHARHMSWQSFLSNPFDLEDWEAYSAMVDPAASQAEILASACGLPGVFEPPAEHLTREVLSAGP